MFRVLPWKQMFLWNINVFSVNACANRMSPFEKEELPQLEEGAPENL